MLVCLSDIYIIINIYFLHHSFNKGYNFAGWMDGWTPELKVTRDVWFQEIMSRMPNQNKNVNCGMCGDCVRDDTIEYSELKHANYQDLRLIGLDLNQVNVQLVNEIMDAMKTKHLPENNYFGQIPQVHVVHAAGSSEDAWKDVMNCGKGTFEGCSIFDPKMHNEKVKSANKTAFLTVDTVYKTITKSLTHSPESPASVLNAIPKVKSRQPIDILLIDAEGYDADVLQGARRVIKKNLVRVIIFEYHKYCPWPKYSLSAIVERFADNNYVCYFEGQKRLWRLTG